MKPWKAFILGTVVALSLSSTLVVASTGLRNIEVSYRNIRIIVDGVYVNTPDEPFIYQGRTYLPIRAVTEALGQKVEWDEWTSTVSISPVVEKNYLPRPAVNRPSRLNNEDRSGFPWPLPMTTGGVAYAKGIQTLVDTESETVLEWRLDGKYSSLTGIVGLDEVGLGPTAQVEVVATGDDVELARFTLTWEAPASKVDLNLQGIDRLTFRAKSVGEHAALIDFANMVTK